MSYSRMIFHGTEFQVFNKKDKKDKDRERQREASPSHSDSEQRTLGDDEGRVSSKDPITDANQMQRELQTLANKAMDKDMSKLDWLDVVVLALLCFALNSTVLSSLTLCIL